MSATVIELDERNGLSSITHNISNCNFGSANVPNLDPAVYPISHSWTRSYEKWFNLHVTHLEATAIDNIKVWKSNGEYKTGEKLYFNGRTLNYVPAPWPGGVYVPTNLDSVFALYEIPTEEPEGPNIGIGGSLGGAITVAPGYTDYIVMQLDTSLTTPIGDLNQKTITFQWDER